MFVFKFSGDIGIGLGVAGVDGINNGVCGVKCCGVTGVLNCGYGEGGVVMINCVPRLAEPVVSEGDDGILPIALVNFC